MTEEIKGAYFQYHGDSTGTLLEPDEIYEVMGHNPDRVFLRVKEKVLDDSYQEEYNVEISRQELREHNDMGTVTWNP